MRRRLAWAAVAAFIALITAAMLVESPGTMIEPSTHGTGRNGYRALFDTLQRLGFTVARRTVIDVPPDATVWWLETDLCRERDDPSAWPGMELAERGGTAVALLPELTRRRCHLGRGVTLRTRSHASDTAGGAIAQAERRLDPSGHVVQIVKALPGWRPVLHAGDGVLVLERPWGRGRLVVLGDASLFANGELDRGDHAVLAVDLVHAYGAPVFDEMATLRHTRGAVSHLASSSAAPVFVGLAIVALLLAWHGTLVPPRRLPALADPTPRLDAFVESIATLYARTRDHGRVLDRYREAITAALRRHFAMAPDRPVAEVIARAGRECPAHTEALALLETGRTVGDAAALRTATTTLDQLLEEVCR